MKRIFGALMVIGLCLSMAIVTYARDFSVNKENFMVNMWKL